MKQLAILFIMVPLCACSTHYGALHANAGGKDGENAWIWRHDQSSGDEVVYFCVGNPKPSENAAHPACYRADMLHWPTPAAAPKE